MKKNMQKKKLLKFHQRELEFFWKKVNKAKELWQNKAMVVIEKNELKLIYKGTIIAATGSGKTRLQSKLIEKVVKELNGFGIVVVKSPRIALTQQLTKEMDIHVINKKENIHQIMFHSGDNLELFGDNEWKNITKEERKEKLKTIRELSILATTDLKQVLNYINKAKRTNKPLIIQTTYHSFDKLCKLFIKEKLPIDMVLNDECQYLKQKEFYKNISGKNKCNIIREYNFTATPTVGEEGSSSMFWGEDKLNPNYGIVVYKLTPEEAIRKGIICEPRIIDMKLDHTENDARNKNHKIILKSHLELESTLGRPANSLITEAGVKDIKSLLKPQSELMKKACDKFHIMTIASNRTLITDNGVVITREDYFKKVKLYSEDKNISLILIHFDILSEGIDVPSMDAVLFLRRVSISKFYQILGRCLRRDFKKECGYLIIPTYNDYSDLSAFYTELRCNMLDEGYLPMQPPSDDRGGESENSEETEDKKLSHGQLIYQIHVETKKEVNKLRERIKKQKHICY